MLSKGDDAMEEGIHCTLSTLMGKQRVSIQDVHSATGLSRNTISSLYHDRATRIDYATLGKLCTFLIVVFQIFLIIHLMNNRNEELPWTLPN